MRHQGNHAVGIVYFKHVVRLYIGRFGYAKRDGELIFLRFYKFSSVGSLNKAELPVTNKNTLMKTIVLLFASNIFMTFAWYGHLRNMQHKPLVLAVLVSWGWLFEYALQVPANRIGYQTFSLGQLKIMQEIITMIVLPGSPFGIWTDR